MVDSTPTANECNQNCGAGSCGRFVLSPWRATLGQIDAGDSDPADSAMVALTVRSMGQFGIDTQAVRGSPGSNINGAIGTLVVKADVVGAFLKVDDGADGTIGPSARAIRAPRSNPPQT
jgi:hypothetical protein